MLLSSSLHRLAINRQWGIQPAVLERLRAKARRFGVDNLEVHQADAYHLPAPDGSVDVVYTVTVLPEIPDRARALAEVRRVLKPGGTFSDSELLLDPDWPRRRTVKRWCEGAGFRLASEAGGLVEYTLNFVRPESALAGWEPARDTRGRAQPARWCTSRPITHITAVGELSAAWVHAHQPC